MGSGDELFLFDGGLEPVSCLLGSKVEAPPDEVGGQGLVGGHGFELSEEEVEEGFGFLGLGGWVLGVGL